ncbi:lactonase family protein [Paraburkholderia heleia]|uniref:lactonase family protein n=1 Tax=Paraburkholderia heleia TaxID=634127 RepID=UPI0005A60C5C|nr:beta-propeller fold lactonase family protein [Paraburkholderia heleia]
MSQPNPERFFVYVANSKDGDIGVFHLDARSGALTPQARVAAQDNVMPMALSPDRRRLYAATRGADKRINDYAIDAPGGRLAPRVQTPIESSLAYLCAEPQGRFLLGASYGEHRVSLYGAKDLEDGRGAPLQVIGGIEHAHAVIVSADGRFAYASSLDSDRVFAFALEDAGRLVEIGTVDLGAGFGPRHLRFSPNGDVLYVLSEFRATVAACARDAATGMLAARHVSPRAPVLAHLNDGFARPSPTDPVQPDPAVLAKLVWAADLHVSPDGRFVYVSERTTSQILTLRVSQDGALEYVGASATETQPRGFRIDPTGRFLVACGEKSQHVSVYAIDAASGALTPLSRGEGGNGANWVEIVAADA